MHVMLKFWRSHAFTIKVSFILHCFFNSSKIALEKCILFVPCYCLRNVVHMPYTDSKWYLPFQEKTWFHKSSEKHAPFDWNMGFVHGTLGCIGLHKDYHQREQLYFCVLFLWCIFLYTILEITVQICSLNYMYFRPCFPSFKISLFPKLDSDIRRFLLPPSQSVNW